MCDEHVYPGWILEFIKNSFLFDYTYVLLRDASLVIVISGMAKPESEYVKISTLACLDN